METRRPATPIVVNKPRPLHPHTDTYTQADTTQQYTDVTFAYGLGWHLAVYRGKKICLGNAGDLNNNIKFDLSD